MDAMDAEAVRRIETVFTNGDFAVWMTLEELLEGVPWELHDQIEEDLWSTGLVQWGEWLVNQGEYAFLVVFVGPPRQVW